MNSFVMYEIITVFSRIFAPGYTNKNINDIK